MLYGGRIVPLIRVAPAAACATGRICTSSLPIFIGVPAAARRICASVSLRSRPCFCRSAREQDSRSDAADAEGPRRPRPILEISRGSRRGRASSPLSWVEVPIAAGALTFILLAHQNKHTHF